MVKKQYTTNLEVLKRSRQQPSAGDIFVLKPKDRDFYFGRVINPQVEILPMFPSKSHKPNPDWMGALVYIYDVHAPDKLPIPEMKHDRLLLPPLILDWVCWSNGYVQTVASVPLTSQDVLPRHCFYDVVEEQYLNEFGRRVAKRTEPCGIHGLTPFRGLDDEVSRAIGITLAPD